MDRNVGSGGDRNVYKSPPPLYWDPYLFAPRLSFMDRIGVWWLMLRAWILKWLIRYPDLAAYIKRASREAHENGWKVGKNHQYLTPEIKAMLKSNPHGMWDDSPVLEVMIEMRKREALKYLRSMGKS